MDDLAEQPDRIALQTAPLAQAVARCREERQAYRRTGAAASPWCLEVFRRAFGGDQDAWAAVQATFERLMRVWVGEQRAIDVDSVIQDALASFARSAPAHRASLLAGDSLSPTLAYLRSCAKTALLQAVRHERQPDHTVYLDDTHAPAAADSISTAELRLDLMARIDQLLETDQERLIFQSRFVCRLAPKEILARSPGIFADIDAVYAIVQRLTRRLSGDATIRELANQPVAPSRKSEPPASLFMSLLDDGKRSAQMDDMCEMDEATLLDYITGVAPAEVRSAIERSPACMAAADRLSRVMLPLLARIRRGNCPDAGTLVAYQEGRLASAEALLVHRHLDFCPLCQDDARLLAAIDATPLDPPSPLRRIVAAVFRSPFALPQPARGQILHYQTPQVWLNLSVRRSQGQPRTWTIHGQIRTPDGLQLAGWLEAATLRPIDAGQIERAGAVESDGSFAFREVSAGAYEILLLTPEEEIVIRDLIVGDPEP